MQDVCSLSGFRLYLLLTAIGLAAFLISLDGFIINVAIPTIASQMGERLDVGTWLITVFSTASTACVPLAGALSSRIGNYKIFMFGIVLFAAASLFIGVTEDFASALVGRILQGCAAGLLTPITLALIINNFPADKRSVAIGFWSFFVMVGPAMGPMIGGWLADYRWPFLFFMNIPFSFLSAIIVWHFLKDKKEDINPLPLDILGVVLLFVCVGTLQSALNRWNIDDWFNSPFIVTLFVISALCFIFFIIWENYTPNPFINLSFFKNLNFTLAGLTTGIGMCLLFASFVLDTLWVREVLGYTPAWAGLTLTPVGIFPLIFYPIMGRFVTLLDLRIWVILSFLLYAITFFWLSHITVYNTYWQLALPRLVQGIGFAIFTVPNSLLVIRGIAADRLAAVISLFSFLRMLFVGFGVSAAMTLWTFRQAHYQTDMAARFFSSNPLFSDLKLPFQQITHSEPKSLALVYQLLQSQISTLALADIYYLFGWIFIGLCFVVPFYKTKIN